MHRCSVRRARGFTLIELLVAVAVLALIAVLSWRGLDGMARAHAANKARGDALLTLQTSLAQWGADLDATLQLPGTSAIDWDGRVLRLTRAGADPAQPAVEVVAWTLRAGTDGTRWRRWQSAPLRTQGEWRQAWAQAAARADGSDADAAAQNEVALLPLQGWQLLYFRNGQWSAPTPAADLGGLAPLPDGVRLVLELPPGAGPGGSLVRDWVGPTVTPSRA